MSETAATTQPVGRTADPGGARRASRTRRRRGTRRSCASLVKHLHAFAVDVQLTEEEWAYGIDFLTRTGHITDDKRQEFILLSDVLGLSMQVIGINHAVPDGATENTVFGPFFVANSPAYSIGDDIANGASGIPCYFHGTVSSAWMASRSRAPPRDLDGRRRGQLRRSVRRSRPPAGSRAPLLRRRRQLLVLVGAAGGVSDPARRAGGRPAQGRRAPPEARLRTSTSRSARRATRPCTTHVFVDGDEYLDSDAVFGVKSSLIQGFEHHDAGNEHARRARHRRRRVLDDALRLWPPPRTWRASAGPRSCWRERAGPPFSGL